MFYGWDSRLAVEFCPVRTADCWLEVCYAKQAARERARLRFWWNHEARHWHLYMPQGLWPESAGDR